jgi:hypothetical protein
VLGIVAFKGGSRYAVMDPKSGSDDADAERRLIIWLEA